MQKVPSAFTFFAIANKVTYQFEIHIKKRSTQKAEFEFTCLKSILVIYSIFLHYYTFFQSLLATFDRIIISYLAKMVTISFQP